MADLPDTLPQEVEIGAVRSLDWGVSVVRTDGGHEVRNARWSTPLRTYDISFPHATRDDATYLAVLQLYEDAQGSLLSFNFTDWTDSTTVEVRFDSPLQIETPAGHLDHIVSMRLKEVR